MQQMQRGATEERNAKQHAFPEFPLQDLYDDQYRVEREIAAAMAVPYRLMGRRAGSDWVGRLFRTNESSVVREERESI